MHFISTVNHKSHTNTCAHTHQTTPQTYIWWIFQTILLTKRSKTASTSSTSQYSFFPSYCSLNWIEWVSFIVFIIYCIFWILCYFFSVSKFSIFEFDLLKRRFDFHVCVPVLAIFPILWKFKQYFECTNKRRSKKLSTANSLCASNFSNEFSFKFFTSFQC